MAKRINNGAQKTTQKTKDPAQQTSLKSRGGGGGGGGGVVSQVHRKRSTVPAPQVAHCKTCCVLFCVLDQPRVYNASAASLGPIGLIPLPSLLALSAEIICQCCLGVVCIEVCQFSH